MYFNLKEREHSHIHALYDEYMGEFSVKTSEMIRGDLPVKAQNLVKEWLQINRDKVQEMWDTQIIRKLPPLE